MSSDLRVSGEHCAGSFAGTGEDGLYLLPPSEGWGSREAATSAAGLKLGV